MAAKKLSSIENSVSDSRPRSEYLEANSGLEIVLEDD
jgi:hypothetical protein